MGLLGGKEPAEIVELKKKAAAGDLEAKYQLGLCYFQGHGVIQDARTAGRYLGNAAQHGHAKAQCFMGKYFLDINNVEQGLVWLEKAAAQGDSEAIEHLAQIKPASGKAETQQAKAAAPKTPTAGNFCTQCGQAMQEGAKFCGNCGAKVEQAERAVELYVTDALTFPSRPVQLQARLTEHRRIKLRICSRVESDEPLSTI